MVLAMRHGVLGYEAMDLNRLFPDPAFGVFSYEATRGPITCHESDLHPSLPSPIIRS